jgi:hypothetical protein
MKTLDSKPLLLAFHADPAVKEKYLTRVRAHRLADEIVQGYGYWQNGKGCAVGCTLHSSNHGAYETEMGIPRILARLEDRIFEGLPNDEAKTWPERFLSAAAPGADLSGVWPKWAHWMLVDPTAGVLRLAKREQSKLAIQGVADLYQRLIDGEAPSVTEWSEARSKADAADAASYAADAAYAASYAAYAADAASYAADAADARKKFFGLASEKLLELMAAAPVAHVL